MLVAACAVLSQGCHVPIAEWTRPCTPSASLHVGKLVSHVHLHLCWLYHILHLQHMLRISASSRCADMVRKHSSSIGRHLWGATVLGIEAGGLCCGGATARVLFLIYKSHLLAACSLHQHPPETGMRCMAFKHACQLVQVLVECCTSAVLHCLLSQRCDGAGSLAIIPARKEEQSTLLRNSRRT